MRVKCILSFVYFLLLLHVVANAQLSDSFKSRKGSWVVSCNPVPLVIKQFTMGVEYFHKENKSFSVEGGFALALLDTYSYLPLFINNSVIVRLSNSLTRESKYSNRYLRFHSIGLNYRRFWNNSVTAQANSSDDVNSYQRRKGYSIGSHYQFGFRIIGRRVTFNPFVLGGITLRYLEVYTFGSSLNHPPHTYTSENDLSTGWFPSIDFEVGARIGFRFKPKEQEASRD